MLAGQGMAGDWESNSCSYPMWILAFKGRTPDLSLPAKDMLVVRGSLIYQGLSVTTAGLR